MKPPRLRRHEHFCEVHDHRWPCWADLCLRPEATVCETPPGMRDRAQGRDGALEPKPREGLVPDPFPERGPSFLLSMRSLSQRLRARWLHTTR